MRISIVEDDYPLLEKLTLLLNGENGFNIVGSYPSAEEALAMLDEAKPEIMLIDLTLPRLSGIELIARIKQEIPATEIIAYTGSEDREVVLSAMKAGASGYILKGSSPRELIEAIHEVSKGGSPMSSRIARTIVKELWSSKVEDQLFLTKREQEILRRVDKGLSYKEIAEELNISNHTVHTHIKNAYEKLQANSRKEALKKARRNGIL